jgi:hypothetical protein
MVNTGRSSTARAPRALLLYRSDSYTVKLLLLSGEIYRMMLPYRRLSRPADTRGAHEARAVSP